ncbi:hypothetical protein [Kribbella speibonae]|uniref:Uncharacterized protein n=1 Tax=Kribbella speibonae TaxID=1572660 RepID=A0A4R0J0N3_9ACTN|nr:hypothetical protein [Kribbella speibonae]TCC38880.1 hypothetical protein E0H92_21170 [Kribbella speibonae]
MIEITHTPAEGTVAWGVRKEDGPAEILRAANWTWSRHLDAWHLPGSRYQAVKTSRVDATVAELEAAGFAVSVRIDEAIDAERTNGWHSLQWVARQIARLQANLTKIDRQLEHLLPAIGGGREGSVGSDLWAIRLLSRRIKIGEQLRHWHEIIDVTSGQIPGITREGSYVRIAVHGRELDRGNHRPAIAEVEQKDADRAPYDTTGHSPADDPDGPRP